MVDQLLQIQLLLAPPVIRNQMSPLRPGQLRQHVGKKGRARFRHAGNQNPAHIDTRLRRERIPKVTTPADYCQVLDGLLPAGKATVQTLEQGQGLVVISL